VDAFLGPGSPGLLKGANVPQEPPQGKCSAIERVAASRVKYLAPKRGKLGD